MEKEKIVRKDGIVYERKRRTGVKMDNSILIRLYTDELEQLRVLAEQDGTKTSTYVRNMIRKQLKKKGK